MRYIIILVKKFFFIVTVLTLFMRYERKGETPKTTKTKDPL